MSELAKSSLLKTIAFTQEELHWHTLAQGQCLDASEGVYYIVNGQVEVYSMALDGYEVYLSTLHEGDCFGFSTLLVAFDMQTVLIMACETTLISVDKKSMESHLQNNPTLASRFLAICNTKLQFLLSRITQLTLPTARQKVGYFLLQYTEGSLSSTVFSSWEKLASYLGVSRATLFRELAFYRDKHLLTGDLHSLQIGDKKQILQIVQSTKKEGHSS